MSKGISTAGMTLSYIVASGASIPSTGTLIKIPEVKTMPSFNTAPNGIDITPLDEEDAYQYTADLKDFGGVFEFGANLTNELEEAWNTTLMAAYTGRSTGEEVWFCISHPKLTNATWFYGEPIKIGMNEASVGAAAETSLFIAPHYAPTRAAKI